MERDPVPVCVGVHESDPQDVPIDPGEGDHPVSIGYESDGTRVEVISLYVEGK